MCSSLAFRCCSSAFCPLSISTSNIPASTWITLYNFISLKFKKQFTFLRLSCCQHTLRCLNDFVKVVEWLDLVDTDELLQIWIELISVILRGSAFVTCFFDPRILGLIVNLTLIWTFAIKLLFNRFLPIVFSQRCIRIIYCISCSTKILRLSISFGPAIITLRIMLLLTVHMWRYHTSRLKINVFSTTISFDLLILN